MVGTLGHVDHGKTLLVKALTGVDCDRWAEEKERGITIDIGFAHLKEDDLQVGFVDVPGHERFLHNALAGLGGIRVGMLVVAATEGIMPQTREHLAICSLLGIPSVLVALTKVDLVEDDLAELAQLEIEEFLETTPYAGAPVFRVSAVSGHGIRNFRHALLDLASRHVIDEHPQDPARFPIDRAFLLKGLGTVVTGTLVSGVIAPGDRLLVLPGGEEARIRNVQVHGENRDQATAGERTSLQVTGVGLETLRRGLQLVTPNTLQATRSLCVRFHHLGDSPIELNEPTEIHFHLYATEVVGTLRPLRPDELGAGTEGIAEIRLREPVAAVRGDRFIVRRPSPATTIGGGTILDPAWRRPRSSQLPATLDALSGSTEDAVLRWFEGAGPQGLDMAELRPRLPVRVEELQDLVSTLAAAGHLLEITTDSGQTGRWISSAVFERVVTRASKVLERFFVKNRLAPIMPKAELAGQVVPNLPGRVTDWYLAALERRGVLHIEDDAVRLPGFEVQLSDAEGRAVEEILQVMEGGGLSPPDTEALKKRISFEAAGASDAAIEYLLGSGKLVRLPGGAMIATSAVDSMRQALLESGKDRLSVQEFKDLFDLTRKWAIPLLEHLDSMGFTRRAGDVRLIVRPNR